MKECIKLWRSGKRIVMCNLGSKGIVDYDKCECDNLAFVRPGHMIILTFG